MLFIVVVMQDEHTMHRSDRQNMENIFFILGYVLLVRLYWRLYCTF